VKQWLGCVVTLGSLAVLLTVHRLSGQRTAQEAVLPPAGNPASISIDYPADGSLFPPDFAPPTFLWRDPDERAASWRVEIALSDGSPSVVALAAGERMQIGEIDPRCVAPTNRPPELTPEQAAARTWTPDARTWEAIKSHSVETAATVTISGLASNPLRVVSFGRVTIRTSGDPVGAPIFFRDVPLMPTETKKGVIKPLAPNAVPLIAWRVRNVSETRSRVVLTGMHTCANCHSFSDDGKTLGMDLDGPQNDKGLYALVSLRPMTIIRNEDVVPWTSFRNKVQGDLRVGLMSRVSPDGRYVVTTIKPPGVDRQNLYYAVNFKDYRILQVFYPTHGILVWYDRVTGRMRPLPGADDPRYVQANASWSPDGKYLVFVRAEAKDAYPAGGKMAEYPNDPNELPMQYDLYRIPFNGGKGGRAEPVAGASRNGMSNGFPKISPDGRWIVFVKCRNGMILRPDGKLYIVSAAGGAARRMRCNTPLMNSWHSFSPNGRWLVFSSKSRSPYTQMFLTHIDPDGNDSPAILVENATAANRAVNLPEFVNISADGLMKIDAPATEFYRLADLAAELTGKREYNAAIAEWKKALALTPDDARSHNNFGYTLAQAGRLPEAVAQYQRALELQPEYAEAQDNLGVAMAAQGKPMDAIAHYRKALDLNPEFSEAHNNLGRALAEKGKLDESLPHFEKALELNAASAEAHTNLGAALLSKGDADRAITQLEGALRIAPESAAAHRYLGDALASKGKLKDALEEWRKVLRVEPNELAALDQAAWVLATSPDPSLRNGGEAVELAERANRVSSGNEPRTLVTLAAAYAEAGRFSEAVENARSALGLATAQNNQALAGTVNAMIALYKAKTALRAPPQRPPMPFPSKPV
jgi:tetratricopeptide (TPR) repeat protein